MADKAPKITKEELTRWYQLRDTMAKAKDEEMLLRKKIFAAYFPKPSEGVNKSALEGVDGWIVKGTHKITRNVDEALLKAKQEELLAAGIAVATLVRQKPELETKVYKALDKAQRALFDQVLEIKDGAPTLEIIPGAL